MTEVCVVSVNQALLVRDVMWLLRLAKAIRVIMVQHVFHVS